MGEDSCPSGGVRRHCTTPEEEGLVKSAADFQYQHVPSGESEVSTRFFDFSFATAPGLVALGWDGLPHRGALGQALHYTCPPPASSGC